MKTKTLNSLGVVLTPDECALACSIINSTEFGGEDGRPLADGSTMGHFAADYFCAAAGLATDSGKLAELGTKTLDKMCKRVRAAMSRTPNGCDGCGEPGTNGTMPIDGEHALVVCCPKCATKDENPEFTPF